MAQFVVGSVTPLRAQVSAQAQSQGQTQTPILDPAIAFGERERVEQASLSPDGKKLAYITPMRGQGSVLMIFELEPTPSAPKAILKLDGNPSRMGTVTGSATHA